MIELDHKGIPCTPEQGRFLQSVEQDMLAQLAIQLWYNTDGVGDRFLELVPRTSNGGYSLEEMRSTYLAMWNGDDNGWRTAAIAKAKAVNSMLLDVRT